MPAWGSGSDVGCGRRGSPQGLWDVREAAWALIALVVQGRWLVTKQWRAVKEDGPARQGGLLLSPERWLSFMEPGEGVA